MGLYKLRLLLIFSMVQLCFSQELPPIQTFTPQDYNAEDQNWSVSQSESGNIYVANNRGLLEYNGANWQLYQTPNNSIVRSVKVINTKIYTGFYMDFGYWEKDQFGRLNYTSITKTNNIEILEDEEFWNIFSLDQWLIFQSLDRIYIYNSEDKTVNVVGSDVRISKMFQVNGEIYFQQLNRGLFKIINGKALLVSDHNIIYNHIITNIFPHKLGLLVQTKENGFYIFNDDKFEVWNTDLDNILKQNSIYSSIKLKNGTYILGSVSNGLMHVDADGSFIFQVDQRNGLNNNTVLSLFEDKLGNIWVALDNGINVININAPFKEYIDNLGVLGTVYTAIIHDQNLFLGTNQGLFYKKTDSNDSFKSVEGTNGQVWNLQLIDQQLFCSHDKGTFIIENLEAKNIFRAEGTWKLSTIKDRDDLLIQGNYDGFYILQKDTNGQWKYRNKLKGFNSSSRYYEFLDKNTLVVSHEYKGVYTLTIDDEYYNVTKLESNGKNGGIKSSLITFKNDIFYAYDNGVYAFDPNTLRFSKDTVMGEFYITNGFISGKLVRENVKDRMWMFADNSLGFVQSAGLTSQLKLTDIPLPSMVRKTKPGFENILPLKNDQYLLGTTNGYIVIDLNKIETTEYNITINEIVNYELNQTEQFLNVQTDSLLPVKSNNIKFTYSTPNYNKFSPTKYSYKLEGFNQDWSVWAEDSQVLFENLPYGSYKFLVKSKVGNNESVNIADYTFRIKKPWLLSSFAMFLYFIALLVLIFLMHNVYKNHYKKQRNKLLKQKEVELEIKDLENQKQLMLFKNKTLQQDVDSKNKELGISTMNLIKKNELLNDIKKEISAANKLEDLKRVIKLINKNINNTDDWKAFEEAFNNADKDFLKKIKSLHPNLTSNDLKICAYLRLNLTSKEIAPLLNISTKSVEVKRYRLRKKMNLDREINLTNYILEL